jgi:hypothetical protein
VTPQALKALERCLQQVLEDLLKPLVRMEGRHWAWIYVHGRLLHQERKSNQPMTSRIAGGSIPSRLTRSLNFT